MRYFYTVSGKGAERAGRPLPVPTYSSHTGVALAQADTQCLEMPDNVDSISAISRRTKNRSIGEAATGAAVALESSVSPQRAVGNTECVAHAASLMPILGLEAGDMCHRASSPMPILGL